MDQATGKSCWQVYWLVQKEMTRMDASPTILLRARTSSS